MCFYSQYSLADATVRAFTIVKMTKAQKKLQSELITKSQIFLLCLFQPIDTNKYNDSLHI